MGVHPALLPPPARTTHGRASVLCSSVLCFFFFRGETTSTAPSTTLMAVSSSIAYAGPAISAAHFSAAAIVFSGRSGFPRCGKIEKSTTPSVLSPAGECQVTKSSPIRGVITMLPALKPTQTVFSSEGRRSARPDARIQWHKYAASPPSTTNTSVARTSGTQRSASRLGSAVSSSTPTDFHPSPTIGQRGSCPLMNRHALRGPAIGCPYPAVGMQRASHSAIGLPSSSTSALWMLAFLMPAEVRRYFIMLLLLPLPRSDAQATPAPTDDCSA